MAHQATPSNVSDGADAPEKRKVGDLGEGDPHLGGVLQRRASCRRAKITVKGAPKGTSPAAMAQAPPLTLIFHGKIRRLLGGRTLNEDSSAHRQAGQLGSACERR